MKNDYVYYLENRVELSENSVRLFLFDVTLYDENPNADLKEIFISSSISRSVPMPR